MPDVQTISPSAAYLTKPNIIHPQSERGAAGSTYVTAAEAAARLHISDVTGVTVSGGAIQRGH